MHRCAGEMGSKRAIRSMNNARVITPDNSSTTSLSVSRDHPDFSLHNREKRRTDPSNDSPEIRMERVSRLIFIEEDPGSEKKVNCRRSFDRRIGMVLNAA